MSISDLTNFFASCQNLVPVLDAHPIGGALLVLIILSLACLLAGGRKKPESN